MSTKRFTGPSIREVMARVKEELGDEAVILSNRKKPDGQFEIIAISEENINEMATESIAPKPSVEPRPAPAIRPLPASSAAQFKPFVDVHKARIKAREAEHDLEAHVLPDPLGANLDPVPSRYKRRQQASAYGSFAATDALGEEATEEDTAQGNTGSTLEPGLKSRTAGLSKEQQEEIRDDLVLEEKAASLSAADRFEKDLKKGEAISRWSSQILGDIHGLQSIVRRQILPRVNESQMYAQCHQVLLNAGFSVGMVQTILSELPQHLLNGFMDREKVSQWLEKAVAQQIKSSSAQDVGLTDKTIITLMGSTGIGKSTCAAKIAAGLVMKHEPSDIIMITLDADHPHLYESYADVIGVDFQMIEPYQDLALKLAQLPHKIVILDSPGMGHKHPGIQPHLERLTECKGKLVALLTLNASNSREGNEVMIQAYHKHASAVGLTLNQCAVTKLDEAIRLGSLLSVMAEYDLSLAYQSSSQELFDGFELAGVLPLVKEAISSTDGLASIDALFGREDQSLRFDAMREKILENVTEMGRTLNILRQEMKNAGFADKARSSLNLVSHNNGFVEIESGSGHKEVNIEAPENIQDSSEKKEAGPALKPANFEKRGKKRSSRTMRAAASNNAFVDAEKAESAEFHEIEGKK